MAHVGAGGERLGEIAGIFDAAVGDHRHVGFLRGLDRIHDRGELRHADAGDDARGADRARADADLDRVGAGIDQRLGALLVAILPAMTCTALESRLMRLTASSTREEWPCAVSTTIRSTPASISRSVRSKPPSPTVVAAATRSRPCASLQAFGLRPPSRCP
jgi:hypothetical protein